MVWRDRDYNREGSEGSGSYYFGNPAGLLSFSIPFGTWLGARVRLHFWLLMPIIFYITELVRGVSLQAVLIAITLLLLAVLLHEFGHRITASLVGGQHNDFMLWFGGGMIPPTAPPQPWPAFVAHSGGIIVNLLLMALSILVLYPFSGVGLSFLQLLNPLLVGPPAAGVIHNGALLTSTLQFFALLNASLVAINLLPYYWFDGAYLLQSILWPFTGLHRAVNVTCIIGMVLAVPMFFLFLINQSLMGMIFWALLFASSYSRRKQLIASGSGQWEDAIAQSAAATDDLAPLRRSRPRWAAANAKAATRRRARELREQAKVDRILDKVREKGMHSLSWWEKRTLRKATERQRKR